MRQLSGRAPSLPFVVRGALRPRPRDEAILEDKRPAERYPSVGDPVLCGGVRPMKLGVVVAPAHGFHINTINTAEACASVVLAG